MAWPRSLPFWYRGTSISRRDYAWLIGGYLCSYVALDWVSYLYPMAPPLAITPWNPQTGLSLALLLRSGLRNAPWLFVASLVADLLVRGPHLPPPLTVVMPALPAAVYTALAALLRGPFRFDPEFASLRDATILVAAAAIGAGLLAVGFVGALDLAGFLPTVSVGKSVAQFWIGDLIGIVVMTPLLLVFTRATAPSLHVPLTETMLQTALVVAALWLVFASHLFDELKLFYVVFLPLMWIAMRHGIEGTTVATLVIQVGLIVAMWLGGYGAATVLEFQFLLLAVAVTGLCLLDLRLPGFDGLAVQTELAAREIRLPIIMLTAHGDAATARAALKSGAFDFLEKPIDDTALRTIIEAALSRDRDARDRADRRAALQGRLARLTPREREVLEFIVQGRHNREMAAALGISPRTIEVYKARLMDKLQVDRLPDLIRIALDLGLSSNGG